MKSIDNFIDIIDQQKNLSVSLSIIFKISIIDNFQIPMIFIKDCEGLISSLTIIKNSLVFNASHNFLQKNSPSIPLNGGVITYSKVVNFGMTINKVNRGYFIIFT